MNNVKNNVNIFRNAIAMIMMVLISIGCAKEVKREKLFQNIETAPMNPEQALKEFEAVALKLCGGRPPGFSNYNDCRDHVLSQASSCSAKLRGGLPAQLGNRDRAIALTKAYAHCALR